MGPSKPKQIVEWIRKNYPNEETIENSYRSDLMANSINHPSQHHFPAAEKFLWYDSTRKTYRLAEDSERNIVPERKIRCSSPDKEPLIGKLSGSGQITIPLRIRDKMGFNAGDLFAFIVNEQGFLELRKSHLKVEYDEPKQNKDASNSPSSVSRT